ncbi:MAG: epoxyqueuosine reductase QueH [Desulfuromonas sp.]|nr:epoxyqueuosine reductase QueH [Desulfuromonas sp.]
MQGSDRVGQTPGGQDAVLRPRLLLHACCAPCSSAVVERLQQSYAVTIFFYNPNIHPQPEYQLRCSELEQWCQHLNLPLIVDEYIPEHWHQLVAGYEQEAERGERCTLCYRMRMQRTAQRAKDDGFALFTTVLSISPHKDAERINRIGAQLSSELEVDFYTANFKKQGGFQRSLELSKLYGFYRQNYCGCCYSLAQSEQRRSASRTLDSSS